MLITSIRILLVALSAYLYSLGGREGTSKAIRRLGVPLMVGVWLLLSSNWYGFISLPVMFGVLSLGYGKNSPIKKFWLKMFSDEPSEWLTRLVCGFLYGASGLAILWGNWVAFGFHMLLTTVGTMLAGRQLFKGQKAEMEEAFIGLLFVLMPILG